MNPGYGSGPNPYDQRGGSYGGPYDPPSGSYNAPQHERYNSPQRVGYSSQPYGNTAPEYRTETQYNGRQPAMGRDPYATNVEMEPLAPNGQSFAGQDSNAILNECRRILDIVQDIESRFGQVQSLQQQSRAEADIITRQRIDVKLEDFNAQIMNKIREATSALRSLKQKPESGNPRFAPQVGNVQRRLQAATRQYKDIEFSYENFLKSDYKRNYKTVHRDASEAEIEQAMQSTSSQQVFSQALMQSTRSGQATSAMNAVRNRHDEIQKIEQQMIELAQLFQDMEALVVQQEAAVTVIEQKGEEVVENLDKGNEQLDSGIKSARARNRKKWWCLLICVIIIVIIVVVVIIYVKVINPPKSSKRSVVGALQARYLTAPQPWTPRGRLALRDTPWTA